MITIFQTLTLSSLLVVVALLPQPAQAVTLDEAVERIDAMIAEMTALKTQLSQLQAVSTPTPQIQGVQTTAQLTMDLSYGQTNEDIAKIQRLLATDAEIYPYGVDSGFFGPKTQEAIRNFQARFDLDTVGVIGPATKALLELFLNAYPTENYPADILTQSVPQAQVLGATADATVQTTAVPSGVNKYSKITVTEDADEFIVRSFLLNGDRVRDFIIYPDTEAELIELIAEELSTSETEVTALVRVDNDWFGSSRSRNADEDDAEDAIDDADEALDRLRDMLEDAEDDGVDIDDAEELYEDAEDLLDDAEDAFDIEDYDEAVDLAEAAEELADEAEDELDDAKDDSEEIDEIRVDVKDGESEVTVEYENGDEEEFEVKEDDRDDIIEAIADELNIDEDEVEDVIEFEYGDIDRVEVTITDETTRVRIYFESGYTLKHTSGETDEDDLVEELADEYDLDEDDVERFMDVEDRR